MAGVAVFTFNEAAQCDSNPNNPLAGAPATNNTNANANADKFRDINRK